MPFYLYACPLGHGFETFLKVASHVSALPCRQCELVAKQVITAPMMVKVAGEVCYDSPINGQAITSWDAHREDLKRNQCIPYDPGMKKDAERTRNQQDAALDQSVQTHAEQMCAKLSTKQKGKLWSELTEQGVGLDCVRSTPNG